MAETAQQEFHLLLDDLCKQGVYGSVTFYFKDGDITLVKDQLEFNTRQVLEAYSGKKPRRVLVIQKKSNPPVLAETGTDGNNGESEQT
ncbi:MAG: hypothetical protein SAMD01599839_08060 [Rectinema sp.]